MILGLISMSLFILRQLGFISAMAKEDDILNDTGDPEIFAMFLFVFDSFSCGQNYSIF
jgi:hypothetical protein